MNCFLLLNMFLHINWCLYSVVSSESVNEASVSSLLSKRATLLKQLEYIFPPSQVGVEMKLGNQLAIRVRFFLFVICSLCILLNSCSKCSSLAHGLWISGNIVSPDLIIQLCTRFVQYLLSSGAYLENLDSLLQHWKIWDFSHNSLLLRNFGNFASNSLMYQVSLFLTPKLVTNICQFSKSV